MKIKSLEEIYEEINNCTKCRLYKSRLDNVYYKWRGNPETRLMFIGEALGAVEQREGFPFVGRAGKLLDELLENIELSAKDDAYFSNICHCRPPENRDPLIDEIKACQSFLIEEIRIINPKLIITLGRVSGNWWNHYRPYSIYQYYPDRRWFPMYHTAYLLRQPKIAQFRWKKALLEAIKEVGL